MENASPFASWHSSHCASHGAEVIATFLLAVCEVTVFSNFLLFERQLEPVIPVTTHLKEKNDTRVLDSFREVVATRVSWV